MAEDSTQSGMDYSEHDRTYDGFIALTKIGSIHVITIVVAIAIFGFGGPWSFTLGVVTLLLAIVSAAIGAASRGSIVPPTLVLGLAFVFFIMSVAT